MLARAGKSPVHPEGSALAHALPGSSIMSGRNRALFRDGSAAGQCRRARHVVHPALMRKNREWCRVLFCNIPPRCTSRMDAPRAWGRFKRRSGGHASRCAVFTHGTGIENMSFWIRYYGYGSPRLRAKVAAAEPGQFKSVRVMIRRIEPGVISTSNLVRTYWATTLDVQVSESKP